MLIEEGDAGPLKTWVVTRLQDISDADSDVLADYVLALIRTDTPHPQLRADVLEALEDFLQENTNDFVNEVFKAIQTGSYKPGYAPPTSNHAVPGATAVSHRPGLSAPSQQQSNDSQSRKRSYNDTGLGGPDPNTQYASRGDRQMKQMRGRGGRGGRGNGYETRGGAVGFQQNNGLNPHAQSASPPAGMPPGFPTMPNIPGMPQFDPNDPMAAMMAMQAMGMAPMPGMEGFNLQQMGVQGSPGFKQNGGKGTDVCRDYVNKGYCTRGDSCPWQHTNPVVVPGQDEYDPKDASMSSPVSVANDHHFNNHLFHDGHSIESRGRGRGRGDRGRGRGNDRGGFRKPNRADFSHAGPNNDRTITTVVVEQIPEEKFSEEAVREFFSEFGAISEITLQPYKRLATVKYTDYSAARAAYDSPKVIFDNRFVKVYWYKPGSVPTPPADASTSDQTSKSETPTEPPLDMAAFAVSAAAAQAKLDAKRTALADMTSKREALEKQKADLAAKQAAEKQKLLDRLAAKGQSLTADGGDTTMADPPPSTTNGAATPKAGDSEHTKMLRAKVAELEAEAKSLGLPDSALADSTPTWTPRGRGRGRGTRGSYRGWEGFDPSHHSSSSSTRGRGRGNASPFVPARGGSGQYNLDLRTKRVAVSLPPGADNPVWTTALDEGLRQYLLGVGEYEDVHAQGDGVQVVAFKDRGTAEAFFYGVRGRDVPGVGKVEVKWVQGPALGAAAAAATAAANGGGDGGGGLKKGDEEGLAKTEGEGDAAGGEGLAGKVEVRGGGGGGEGAAGVGDAERDYDVAEDDDEGDDSWMEG